MDNYKIAIINSEQVNAKTIDMVYNVEKECNDDNAYTKEMINEILVNPNVDSFLCIDNNDIVGFMTVNNSSKHNGGSIYINNLGVLPKYQQHGIATSLIESAFEFYADKDYGSIITLDVYRNNPNAYKLYSKLGFEIMEDNKSYRSMYRTISQKTKAKK